jgi:probable HAF family extracellular repeat protein
MRIRGRTLPFVVGSFLLALAAGGARAAAPAQAWTLVDLGTLGGSGSYGSAVSDDGDVAGCSNTSNGEVHAFLWHRGTMVDLAAASAMTGGASCGLAVNDRGVVAGRAADGELVVWDGASATSLGVTGDVGAINDSGLVVGSYDDAGVARAFAWQDGVLRDLGAPRTTSSRATAVNARGDIVGQAGGHAFLYRDGAFVDLGTLGGAASIAKGINDRGEVVGMASDAHGVPTAFLYAGSMQALAGPGDSAGVDISDRGLVVASGEGYYGYLVSGSDVTRLDRLPAVIAKGWHHMEPTGINDRGWIVGTGFDAAGNPRAFLLVPGAGVRAKRLDTAWKG